MKKQIKIFTVILFLLTLAGGTVTSQQPQNQPPWYHWQPELCWIYTNGIAQAGYMCEIPDPYVPCIIQTSGCTAIN
jgi:hypothetical protein